MKRVYGKFAYEITWRIVGCDDIRCMPQTSVVVSSNIAKAIDILLKAKGMTEGFEILAAKRMGENQDEGAIMLSPEQDINCT